MCIPTSPTLYRAKVAKLAEALNEPETNRDAAEAIRALIGEVVLTPGEKRGEVHASLRGELMAILAVSYTHLLLMGLGNQEELAEFVPVAVRNGITVPEMEEFVLSLIHI